MNKKDRIAVVVSVMYFLLPLAVLAGGHNDAGVGFIVTCVPLILYWAYRFIQNDISFLNVKDTED